MIKVFGQIDELLETKHNRIKKLLDKVKQLEAEVKLQLEAEAKKRKSDVYSLCVSLVNIQIYSLRV